MTPTQSQKGYNEGSKLNLDKLEIRKGAVHLILEERPTMAYQVFRKVLAPVDDRGSEDSKGQFNGLVMTRQFPPDIKEEMGLEDTHVFWLTTNISTGEKTISPSAITRMNYLMSEFIQSPGQGIAILDCVEYLITQNSFDTVLRMLQAWNDRIVGTKKIILLTIDPLTLSIQQLHLIKRETMDLLRDNSPTRPRK
jgi:hypothetical protein